jgi:hypothetical protein
MLATLAAYKNVFVVLLLAALLSFCTLQTVRVERSKVVAAELRGKLLEQDALRAAQAAALASLQAESTKRSASSAKAVTAANTATANAKARADALEKLFNVPERCEDALQFAAERGSAAGAW